MRILSTFAASLAALAIAAHAAEFRQVALSFTSKGVTNWSLPAGKVLSFQEIRMNGNFGFHARVPGQVGTWEVYLETVLIGPAELALSTPDGFHFNHPAEALIVMRLDDAVPTVPAPVKPKLEWSPDLVTWSPAPPAVPGTAAGFWRVVIVPVNP